jgi:hypothetical protein
LTALVLQELKTGKRLIDKNYLSVYHTDWRVFLHTNNATLLHKLIVDLRHRLGVMLLFNSSILFLVLLATRPSTILQYPGGINIDSIESPALSGRAFYLTSSADLGG